MGISVVFHAFRRVFAKCYLIQEKYFRLESITNLPVSFLTKITCFCIYRSLFENSVFVNTKLEILCANLSKDLCKYVNLRLDRFDTMNYHKLLLIYKHIFIYTHIYCNFYHIRIWIQRIFIIYSKYKFKYVRLVRQIIKVLYIKHTNATNRNKSGSMAEDCNAIIRYCTKRDKKYYIKGNKNIKEY